MGGKVRRYDGNRLPSTVSGKLPRSGGKASGVKLPQERIDPAAKLAMITGFFDVVKEGIALARGVADLEQEREKTRQWELQVEIANTRLEEVRILSSENLASEANVSKVIDLAREIALPLVEALKTLLPNIQDSEEDFNKAMAIMGKLTEQLSALTQLRQ